MGRTFLEGLPDRWESRKPYFEQARRTKSGVNYTWQDPMLVERGNGIEEIFIMGTLVPIGQRPDGEPEGFYNAIVETTELRLDERRLAMLNQMASLPDVTAATAWPLMLATLDTNAADVPLAMMYEADHIGDKTILRLRGQYGVPEGHPLLVEQADLSSNIGLSPECRRADRDILMIDFDHRFADMAWRGYGVRPKQIAILPLTEPSRINGYLIVGTNPYRPYEHTPGPFLNNLRRVSSSIVSTAEKAKEADTRQHKLQADLDWSENTVRHLVEHASVGMCNIDLNGRIIWANDHFFTLHGLPPSQKIERLALFDMYADEDRPIADQAWNDLAQGASHVNIELRLKRFYTTPLGDQESAHIQVLAFPYKEKGAVKSIMAATTDISRLKWASHFQARLAAEAREAKRQQEAFIDVVSHEMRNPLSAIVHCADEITKSVSEVKKSMPPTSTIPSELSTALQDNAKSAGVILECANHQKRIIDDVLTLSRLDSMLLSFRPSATKPLKLISSITRLFEAELKQKDISYDVTPDPSLADLHVEYLYLDISRVTQIFINLVTNAIKFVQGSENTPQKITISYGASLHSPRDFFPQDMYWASQGSKSADVTENSEWGNGEAVYLTFKVEDTGIGMSEDEINKVFERFRQATMRTHVKYGGSGLGLFISKELAEKQGGEIGVASTPGKGSTFGFYIKTKRAENPKPVSTSTTTSSNLRLGLGALKMPKADAGLSDTTTSNTAPQTLHVLLVEDNLINQQVLVRQLRKAGCLVDVANHGSEALTILDSGKLFDVVLMDLEMPVMDGLTAMQEIRARESDGRMKDRVPMIAVTANVRKEQIESARQAGADSVMQKPFKAIELVHMMKELIPQIKTPSSEPTTPGLIGPLSGMML
ncbi:autoinducer 2 sensor kinase/phosphatase luxQ [Sporormia fimetaria CBS 119925]|uniref:histidine kinase n=1 Tax=Sporormia fimetaria CBS 119925 TaxID=1340428 RepID=A0A6A6VMV6_9PLEO|nr:autoinducer 2 sensor kinase/phosphatase luxQ [Sporormia fimetaria CBS 119925]